MLAEHEMPGVHLGARLPLDTPDIEFGTQTENDEVHPATAAFRELGLPAGATLSEAKTAYHRRVKEVHLVSSRWC